MKGGVCEGKMCGVNGCCFSHGCWMRVIRWILGIAIILIVFGFGVMIGQLRGELGRSSGYRMMHSSYYGGGYGGGYPMMQGGYGGAATNGTQSQGGPLRPVTPSTNQ